MSQTTPKSLDPVKYEVFFHKTDQALNEAQQVIRYLSGSTIVREAGEALEAFYLPSGEAVDIACGILMHFMNVTRVIRHMNKNHYEADDIGIYDGDHFLNNDAYVGGMHVPDAGLVSPLFYEGELLGYAAAISHTTEVGGVEPGGICPSATDAWHDGLHIPPLKLVERGRMRRDVMDLILRSTRDPRTMELDLRARIAGNERTKQRLLELVKEFGVDFFKAASRQLVDDGERFFREKVKKLRPGVYSSRVYVDTLGGGREKLAVIQVDLELRDDGSMILRAPVVSPEQACYNNAFLPAVEGTLFYLLLTQMVFDGRWNSGMERGVTLDVPFGSRINARPDRSVGYATVGICFALAAAISEAISRAHYVAGLEDEVQASVAGSCNFPISAGIDQFGRIYGNIFLSNSVTFGGGGRIGSDGVSNYHPYNPYQYVPDAEGEEMITPTLHLFLGQMPDSGGMGKWRGGTSHASISMVHKTNAAYVTLIGQGSKLSANQGLFGGYPGPTVYTDEVLNSNYHELVRDGKPLPNELSDTFNISQKLSGRHHHGGASISTVPMKSGDVWVQVAPTGGGLGDPLERDPEAVLNDVLNGETSEECAGKVYCVAVDLAAERVDVKETERLRQAKKKERKEKGIPAVEMVKKLVRDRKAGNLPGPALELIRELKEFSPAFQQQLQREEELAAKGARPANQIEMKRFLFRLTPYVTIMGDDTRNNKYAVCSQCGFVYGPAEEDFKLGALVYERDPAEIYPRHLAPDKEWAVLREFYCPGCACQIEVDQIAPGMPIIANTSINELSSRR